MLKFDLFMYHSVLETFKMGYGVSKSISKTIKMLGHLNEKKNDTFVVVKL